MKVKLLHDTVVRFPKDTIVEVSEEEAKRLIAFNNAAKVEEPKAKKPTTKRAAK